MSEELVSTRFDADSVRVLPCFVDQDGTYRLGAADGPSFPQPNEQGRFTRAQRAAVMRHTIPLRAKLVEGRGEANKPPEEWGKEPHLQNLVLLPHRVAENGQIETVCIRDQVFLLDSEQGLLIEKK